MALSSKFGKPLSISKCLSKILKINSEKFASRSREVHSSSLDVARSRSISRQASENKSTQFRSAFNARRKLVSKQPSNLPGSAFASKGLHLHRSSAFASKGLHLHPSNRNYFSTNSRHLKALRIDGKAIAQDIKDEIKSEVEEFAEHGLRAPHLTVILVGNDPASVVYVRNKAKAAEYTGITCEIVRLPDSVTERILLREIELLNSLPNVDGILVQLPLPKHINERKICDAVHPDKDVDGFNVLNVGRFCVNEEAFVPATPLGVLEILRRLNIETFAKNAVVCGRSKIVGMPIAMHLHSSSKGSNCDGDATTVICHRNTPREELMKFTRTADILVTATGVPGLITADMVRDGVVVIDIGITRVVNEQGRARLVGDVDFEGVSQKASLITPVPGGVGPVTVAMVIRNTLIAYKKGFHNDLANESYKT